MVNVDPDYREVCECGHPDCDGVRRLQLNPIIERDWGNDALFMLCSGEISQIVSDDAKPKKRRWRKK